MPALTITPHIENATDTEFARKLSEGKVHQVQPSSVVGIAAGCQSGAPSVAFIIHLPDGTAVFAETTLALLLTAADALKAVHGDPRTGQTGVGGKGGTA